MWAAIDTLAKIATRAGLSSTRLIAYHFEDKNDLMRAWPTTL
ncbi:hypothetical protein [Nocardia tengchongensis]